MSDPLIVMLLLLLLAGLALALPPGMDPAMWLKEWTEKRRRR